jgi:hypothetical protein
LTLHRLTPIASAYEVYAAVKETFDQRSMAGHERERLCNEYFKSIEGSFEKSICIQEKQENAGFAVGLFVFLFVFSLIPLFPYIVSRILPRFTSTEVVALWGLRVHTDSFGLWWAICFCTSLLMLFISYNIGRPSKKLLSERLEPAAMRFALCHAVVDQLRTYQTNRMPRHIEVATKYFQALTDSIAQLLTSIGGFGRYRLFGPDVLVEDFRPLTRKHEKYFVDISCR